MNERELLSRLDLLKSTGLDFEALPINTISLELSKDEWLFVLRRLVETHGEKDRGVAKRVFVVIIQQVRKQADYEHS